MNQTYVQNIQSQMQTKSQMPQPLQQKGWRGRMMRAFGGGIYVKNKRDDFTLPNWMVGKSVLFFFIAFAACSIAFKHFMPIGLAVITSCSVLLFFYGVQSVSRSWRRLNERRFAKNVLVWALVIRLIWVLLSYFLLNEAIYGKLDGFGDDNGWYMDFGKGISRWITGDIKMPFAKLREEIYDSAFDDTGYPFLLAIEYLLSLQSSDVFVPLVIKAILDAYTCMGIYYIARRHFDVGTARMAALFMMFNPIMLFWTSCMLKETEMTFVCVASINMIDSTLSAGKKLTFRGLLPGLAMASLLFFVRTALALVLYLAVFAHIVFVSHKVMSNGKKVLAGVMVAIVLVIGLGDRMMSQSKQLVETVQGGNQQSNMEWRARRENGNAFAKYAGAAVFAPLILTIPFPTMNEPFDGQYMQQELAGGYFIKNVLSFFVIIVMILLLASGEWRKHVFIVAYTLGYLIVLVMSQYAQSGRFHMPIIPMFMIFAAYGVQIARGNARLKRGYSMMLILEVFICLAWNWFKLKGRGMI